MTAESLAEKIARRDRYVAAETAILDGMQSYSTGELHVVRAKLETIREGIAQLNREIEGEQAKAAGTGGASVNKITFVEPI